MIGGQQAVVALVERLRPKISRQLTGDVVWNLVSFAVMGIAGLALNLLIATFYDASTLGVFNQVYAVYILLSQVAVAGIHLSVLKYAAAEPKAADEILIGALLSVVAVASFWAAAGYFASGPIGDLLKSPSVARGLRAVAPGVLFFAINKVLLALHNGLGRLRSFAVFQALRFGLIVGLLLAFTVASSPGEQLPLIFTLAEACLLIALLAFTTKHHSISFSRRGAVWIRRHLAFGWRALFGSLLADVNTRVDILILGYFANDATVGVYSFAALIAEGFSQLSTVFRNVVNPLLAKYRAERTTQELEQKLRYGIRLTYKYTVPMGLVLVSVYPVIVRLLVGPEYLAGWPAFAVLMAGITASMGYSAFTMLLNQGGYPGHQSVFFALTFFTNLLLNVLLVPVMGMLGAAVATGISFVVSIVYLRVLVQRAMGVAM